MMRIVTIFVSVLAITGFATVASAQYMWLDSNGDGVNTASDVLNAVGVPTTVDVYLDTNNNKDGSVAVCNTGDGQPTPNDLDAISYVVNLELSNGTANFTGFTNLWAAANVVLFPGTGNLTQAAMGFGSGTFVAPGTYPLMRVTCTLISSTGPGATLNILGSGLSPDPTSFGTHCSGNDFANTYALGPNCCFSTDWRDTAGLGPAPASGNTAPTVINPGPKSTIPGCLLTFTVVATDPDVPPQTLTFSLGAGAPAGASITPDGAFSWTPSAAQGGAAFPVTYIATDNGTPPTSGSVTSTITVNLSRPAPVVTNPGDKTVVEGALLSYTVTATAGLDCAGSTVTFTLGAGAPEGAAITPAGNFTWTPTSLQGGSSYFVTYIATDNGTPPLSGSARNVITVGESQAFPVMTPPHNMTVDEGSTADQILFADSPDGAPLTFFKFSGPLFMTVTTLSATTGKIHLAPGFGDASPTFYTATVRATDGVGTDSKSFLIKVNKVNRAPTADAGGPYTGTTGIAVDFDGSGSSDPDGDALVYSWNFGDGGTSATQKPAHAYATLGVYPVTLRVTDPGGLFDDDATTASIIDALSATVFARGGNSKTSLGAGKQTTCFQIQPDGGFDLSDVDLGSLVMISPGTGPVSEIAAVGGKTAVGGDSNGDGITEIDACFTKHDMRLLWGYLPAGNNLVDLTFQGNLFSGARFTATLEDYPVKVSGGGVLAATISPNPLNPQATLTFSTSKAGLVRVAMYDVSGRLVRTLAEYPSAPAGYHDVAIDGMNSRGVRLASGKYFVIVSSPDGEERLSVTILK